MNIIEIQSQLKRLPDSTLMQYMQSPSAQVPQFLVLTELQRRKEMRSKAAVNTPQPDDTVAMQTMRDAGVAALPAPTVFKEANFQTGGIVGFAGGGDIDPYMGSSESSATSPRWEWLERLRKAGQDALKKQIEAQNAANPALAKEREKAAADAKAEAEAKAKSEAEAKAKAQADAAGANAGQEQGAAPVAATTPAYAAPTRTAPSVDIPTTTDVNYKSQTPEERRAAARMGAQEYEDYVGGERALKPFQEELTKRAGDIKQDKDRALSLALVQAGFAMMGGKSPYALQNAGEGGAAGLAAYKESMADARKRENDLLNANINLARGMSDARGKGYEAGVARNAEDREENKNVTEFGMKKADYAQRGAVHKGEIASRNYNTELDYDASRASTAASLDNARATREQTEEFKRARMYAENQKLFRELKESPIIRDRAAKALDKQGYKKDHPSYDQMLQNEISNLARAEMQDDGGIGGGPVRPLTAFPDKTKAQAPARPQQAAPAPARQPTAAPAPQQPQPQQPPAPQQAAPAGVSSAAPFDQVRAWAATLAPDVRAQLNAMLQSARSKLDQVRILEQFGAPKEFIQRQLQVR